MMSLSTVRTRWITNSLRRDNTIKLANQQRSLAKLEISRMIMHILHKTKNTRTTTASSTDYIPITPRLASIHKSTLNQDNVHC